MPATASSVMWFRRDLRLADNPALRAAVAEGPVMCLWVADPGILGRRHHRAPVRLRFLRAGLEALDADLRERGSRLVVRHGDPEAVVPRVAAEVGATAVHWAREVSPLGRDRDARVAAALQAAGCRGVEHPGELLVEPDAIPGGSGRGVRVFTPFFRTWVGHRPAEHHAAPREIPGPRVDGVTPEDVLPAGTPLLQAGEAAARRAVVRFIRNGGADAYDEGRNLLAQDGTSRLGPYLRFGMCTSAQVGRALGLPGHLSRGRAAFWRQLGWREFMHHHMWWNPQVATGPFDPRFAGMPWDNDPGMIAAWTEGRTGVPLVDAAMHQLHETGWMHNRTRMVVASYLVKDLLVDWRIGERVFMQHLLDGDPANNNGGWQWTAGSGTDAAPFHRVFNPDRQAERFDPDGAYVARWLDGVDGRPETPIVDHALRRAEALTRFRALSPRR
ncbi:MAG: deoxyribodipyrimidine photo-lyase [Thermoleophilia bacterium]